MAAIFGQFSANFRLSGALVVTKPKLWQNSNCEKKEEEKTQMWQNLESDSSDKKILYFYFFIFNYFIYQKKIQNFNCDEN